MLNTIKSSVAVFTSALFVVAATGCSHIVTIDSDPPGADIYVNGQKVGNAPVSYTEKTGWDKSYQIEARKPGYAKSELTMQQADFNTTVLIGTIAGTVCLLPFFPLPLIGLAFARQLPDRVVVPLERGGRRGSAPARREEKVKDEDDNYDYGY